jgi:hypothetical protein
MLLLLLKALFYFCGEKVLVVKNDTITVVQRTAD